MYVLFQYCQLKTSLKLPKGFPQALQPVGVKDRIQIQVTLIFFFVLISSLYHGNTSPLNVLSCTQNDFMPEHPFLPGAMHKQ